MHVIIVRNKGQNDTHLLKQQYFVRSRQGALGVLAVLPCTVFVRFRVLFCFGGRGLTDVWAGNLYAYLQ